jgi:hypothetical protein
MGMEGKGTIVIRKELVKGVEGAVVSWTAVKAYYHL